LVDEEQFARLRRQRREELEQIRRSPRATGVYIAAPTDACPLCRWIQGTYPKDSDDIPVLPLEGCSRPGGCITRYEPLLVEVGP
jgi:hypothetical protein